ncbi:MAG TPA: hypothetical protein VGK31_10725, partial [Thermoanaerobaculia bacterium]
MDPRRRLVTAIVLTAIAFAAVLGFIGFRLHHWSEIGWAGVNYFPQLPETKKGKPRVRATVGQSVPFMLESGRVVVAIPGAPAARAGINGSDAVMRINGIPIVDIKRLKQLDAAVHTGDVLTYHVRRGKVERDVPVVLASPIAAPRLILSMVISIVLAISFAVVGLIVFIRKPGDRRSIVFYVMSIAGALSFLAGVALSLDGSNLRGIGTTQSANFVVILVYFMIALVFGSLTLHLALIFPRDRPIVTARPYVIRWVYIFPLLVGIIVAALLAIPISAGTPAIKNIEYLLGKGFPYFAGALAIVGAVVALRIARKARTEGIRPAFLSRPVQSVISVYGLLATIALLVDILGARTASRLFFFIVGALPTLGVFAFPVFTFFALYRGYRDSGLEEKRQVKWPLWGTMIPIGTKIFLGLSSFIVGMLVSFRIVEATTWVGVAQMLELIPRILYLLI